MSIEAIVFQDAILKECKDWVLKDPDRENHAFIFCGYIKERESIKVLLTRKLVLTQRDKLENQSAVEVKLKRDYVIEVLEYARYNKLCIIDVHSHPWDNNPSFSDNIDRKYGKDDAVWIDSKIKQGNFPEIEWSMMVVGKDSFKVETWNRTRNRFEAVTKFKFVSRITPTSQEKIDKDIFDRQLKCWTLEGQEKLANINVALIGCGGIGSIISEELVRLGIENLILINGDKIEKSNLNRLIGSTKKSIGKYKVSVLKSYLQRIGTGISVTTINKKVTDNILTQFRTLDMIIGCVDNDNARKILNRFSIKYLIPYLDVASGIKADSMQVNNMGGSIRLIIPGKTPCLQCYRDVIDTLEAALGDISAEEREERRELGYVEGTNLTPEPSVIPLNGIIASIAMNEFSKYVTGFDIPQTRINFDALDLECKVFKEERRPNCPACGVGGYLALGDAPESSQASEDESELLNELYSTDELERKKLDFKKYIKKIESTKVQMKIEDQRE